MPNVGPFYLDLLCSFCRELTDFSIYVGRSLGIPCAIDFLPMSKDNGKIAGVRSEEEIYMIEAAANMYCQPQVEIETQTYIVEGRTVLKVQIDEAPNKPICAIDEENKPKAYIRIADENILATPVHLRVWQHSKKEKGALLTFTEKEQNLLSILKEHELLTLNQCCKQCKTSRATTCNLLADFIRFGLVTPIFQGHKFYFKLNEE